MSDEHCPIPTCREGLKNEIEKRVKTSTILAIFGTAVAIFLASMGVVHKIDAGNIDKLENRTIERLEKQDKAVQDIKNTAKDTNKMINDLRVDIKELQILIKDNNNRH